MKYSVWQITLILTTLINLTTTTHIRAMEVPIHNTRFLNNTQFLRSVHQLPQEIQNAIALLGASEFFLVAKALREHTSSIKSLKVEDHMVKIELYQDEEGYHGKEETLNIHTGQVVSSMHDPYDARFGRHVFTTSLGSGPLFFGVMIPDQKRAPKKRVSTLHLNLNAPEFNTKEEMLARMKNALTIAQTDLINRAYNATKKGAMFIIHHLSEDGKLFLTFDKDVRIYLLNGLNIQLKIDDWFTSVGDCAIQ